MLAEVKPELGYLKWSTGNHHVKIQFCSSKIVKVTWLPIGDEEAPRSYMVKHELSTFPCLAHNNEDFVKLSSEHMQASLNLLNGEISFSGTDGSTWIRETQRKLDSVVKSSFLMNSNSKIFGLGQHQTGVMDYAGQVIEMKHENTSIVVPLLLTDQGFGLLWDNNGKTIVDMT